MMTEQIALLIPSLNPDEKLLRVVTGLVDAGFKHIVVVNDGSDREHLTPFAQIALLPGCTVLAHEVNRGKGRALKTGVAYLLEDRPQITGVVTVDGDGQHQTEDVAACGEALIANQQSLILGVRDFNAPQVPWRSRAGNKLTAAVFRVICGTAISDTQTGLRAFARPYFPGFLDIPGERFEYETNMLLYAKEKGMSFFEQGISTVYLEENASSHFRVIKDSMKIYGAIFRFMISSLLSFLLDIGMFTLLNTVLAGALPMGRRLLAATVAARVLSAAFNYYFNHKAVFRSNAPHRKSAARYALLAAAQMCASYLIVLGLSALFGGSALWDSVFKLFGDAFLFFLSFRIQQKWVF